MRAFCVSSSTVCLLTLPTFVIPAQAGILIYNDCMRVGGYVYILGNSKPILYVGVTSDLIKRVWQHKAGLVDGFTSKYKLESLLYFEVHRDVREAIQREKQIKKWKREWKLNLVARTNPSFKDLYPQLVK